MMEYEPNAINTVGDLIATLKRHDARTPLWLAGQRDRLSYPVGQVTVAPRGSVDDSGDGPPAVWIGSGELAEPLSPAAIAALGWSR